LAAQGNELWFSICHCAAASTSHRKERLGFAVRQLVNFLLMAVNQAEEITFKNNIFIFNIKSKFNLIIDRGHNSKFLKILSGFNILLQEARERCPFYAIKNLLTAYHRDGTSTG